MDTAPKPKSACHNRSVVDALAGIRVLDFTQAWAGPVCTRMLADFGADVVKVESEAKPDLGRIVGPYVAKEPDFDTSGYFIEWNRNKRSLRLNLREPDGTAWARRLASTCDVVVENFAPGVMGKLGLDYEALRAVRSDIVMLSLSGFGATGPLRRAPAYGQQIEAISGLMSVTGYVEGPPLKPGISFPDPISGVAGVVAVLAALRRRSRTGSGCWLDLSMLELTAAQLSEPLTAAQADGVSPSAVGNASPYFAPHGVYRCRGQDRWIAIECHTEEEWRSLLSLLGESSWSTDPRFADLASRLAHREALDEVIARSTREEDAEELTARLQATGVPAARISTIADLFTDPHLHERGFWLTVDHRKVGRLETAGPLARLERTPARVRLPPPLLGEHTDEVLAEATAFSTARVTRQSETLSNGAAPLADLRMVELSSMIAGPYCGKLLAGLGADVVKVEPPAGDPLRRLGRTDASAPGELNPTFLSLNAGKQSVTLDVTAEAGRRTFLQLLKTAHVLLEDLGPGCLDELVGDPWRLNPRLVVTSITPFGHSGPRSNWKGGDLIAWASGGMAHITGEPDQAPLQAGGFQAYHLAGLQAAAGTMIALAHAERTGQGQRVDISLEESVAGVIESAVTDYQYDGTVRGRMGTRHPAAHGVGMQRLADGRWLFVGTCPTAAMWNAVRELMGDPEWARDPRWQSHSERRAHADEMDRLASEWFASATSETTFEPMLERGIPVGLVNDAHQVLALPQLTQRQFFEEALGPATTSLRIPGTPWRSLTGDRN